ncbi:MAG TPA: NAD(P)H-binding protein [Thermoanaerobaculia bacterium]|nr:NAD(P)H-binding protein [Thermoanaerobaculia bacterium]
MNVFITGSTGYIGRHLVPELAARGHIVRALVRPMSIAKLAADAKPVLGDALNADTFAHSLAPSDTLIHLVGVPHPSPSKANDFRKIDLVSIRETVRAVARSTIRHVIYLSVAHPAPVMRDYIAVREEGERLLRESGVASTFVRPWYVLGPGHWWPYAVLPAYWVWGAFPKHRDTARRLYPVKLRDVVRAIAGAVDAPPRDGVRVIEAPELRASATPVRPAVPSAPAHPRP